MTSLAGRRWLISCIDVTHLHTQSQYILILINCGFFNNTIEHNNLKQHFRCKQMPPSSLGLEHKILALTHAPDMRDTIM